MYEPIFLAKVRSARTVTIPAGGWIILGSPDQPLHASIEARAKLVRNGNVNDEFSTVIIGRIQDTHTPTRFATTAEAKKNAELEKSHQDSLSKNHQDALQRQKDLAISQEERNKKLHAAQLVEINAQNDAIRNRGIVAAAPAEEAQPELTEKTPGEIRRDELLALKRDELLALIAKITPPIEAKGTKGALVAAILKSEGIELPVSEIE